MALDCHVPESQRARRTLCPCGGRNVIRVIVEYVLSGQGRIDYVGGTFCYHSDALIDIAIPDGATPVQAIIYDLHEPDEVIRITFTQSPRPGEVGIPASQVQAVHVPAVRQTPPAGP